MLRILKLATSFSKENDPADDDLVASSESKTKTNASEDGERYVLVSRECKAYLVDYM